MTNGESIESTIQHAREEARRAMADDGWTMLEAGMVLQLLAEIARLRSTPEPPGNVWIRTADRRPTDEESEREYIVVAYLNEDGWEITDTIYKGAMWQMPHMKTPDFWTFARLLAPKNSAPSAAGEKCAEPSTTREGSEPATVGADPYFKACPKGHVAYARSFDECPSCKVERTQNRPGD